MNLPQLLLPLHLGVALLLLAALAMPRWRRQAPYVVMLLVATVFLQLKWGGAWVDMPSKIASGGLLLLLPWAVARAVADAAWRPFETLAPTLIPALAPALSTAGGFLYAGFFLTVAAQSIRNGAPLPPPSALRALLLGGLLLLLPWLSTRWGARGAMLLLLAPAFTTPLSRMLFPG